MRTSVLTEYVALRAEAEQQSSDRFVDLAIRLIVSDVDTSGTWPSYQPETDEVLIEVGGRWDRQRKCWCGEARAAVDIRLPRGSDQEAPARYLAEWFRLYAQGPRGKHWTRATVERAFRRVYTLMLVGGRRAGKSLLAIAALRMFAVAFPGAIAWAISPTADRNEEVTTELRAGLARQWYRPERSKTDKTLTFVLAHGSRIRCISGYKPSALRQGRCDLALYNEAQDMSRAGWRRLRGAIADRGGMVILACNPPDAEIGRWVETVYELARAEKIEACAYSFTAEGNPFADFEVLRSMSLEEDDPKEYEREVLGKFVPIGDVVYHAWSDSESVIDLPASWADITEELTAVHLRRPFAYVVGMDFQKTPHMVAEVLKFFRDPAVPEDVITVVVDEVIVGEASEEDLVDALEGRRPETMPGRWERAGRVDGAGYDPERCAVVMDASGWFQDGSHSTGKTSDESLRRNRWRWLYRPQRDSERNPDLIERAKVVNARLKNAAGRRRLFALRHCVRTQRALRSLELIDGVPKKKSPFAHICDGVGYPVYRFFARPAVARRPITYDRVKLTRADELRGI